MQRAENPCVLTPRSVRWEEQAGPGFAKLQEPQLKPSSPSPWGRRTRSPCPPRRPRALSKSHTGGRERAAADPAPLGCLDLAPLGCLLRLFRRCSEPESAWPGLSPCSQAIQPLELRLRIQKCQQSRDLAKVTKPITVGAGTKPRRFPGPSLPLGACRSVDIPAACPQPPARSEPPGLTSPKDWLSFWLCAKPPPTPPHCHLPALSPFCARAACPFAQTTWQRWAGTRLVCWRLAVSLALPVLEASSRDSQCPQATTAQSLPKGSLSGGWLHPWTLCQAPADALRGLGSGPPSALPSAGPSRQELPTSHVALVS